MASRKRARAEAEETPLAEPPQHQNGLLHRIRNMWEFANLMQYIYTFGKLAKISEDIEIDDLETECLKPGPSEVLLEMAISLLKFVTSNRGLTPDNFETYARRQYYAKAPSRNPFGDEEQPIKFNDLDVFEKIRVLQQFSAWSFWNPDKIRDRMPEQKEMEQVQWRIEEIGYDRDDRLYYVLDDNRLYRRTDPPIPEPAPPKPKANSKRGRALARAAARKRKLAEENGEELDDQNNEGNENNADDQSQSYKWECLAVTLAEYQSFLDSIKKTRDPNEKILRDTLLNNVIPVIEQAEEAQQKKIQRREKELIILEKLANAKRSSRLAGKQERERLAREAAEEERRREEERLAEIRKQEEKEKIEKERLYRLMTREQRLKDREEKRRKHEEELAAIEEQAKQAENGDSRISERQLKAQRAKREQDLAALQAEDDHWFFDCSGCGVHGQDLDDGTHSVACEKCNVWQHSKCLGIEKEAAERDDFHFICRECKNRIEEANRPKLPPLKFRFSKPIPPAETVQSPVNGEKRKYEGQQDSPIKKAKSPPVFQSSRANLSATMNGAAPPAVPDVMRGHLPPRTFVPTNGYAPIPTYQSQPMANIAMNQQSPSKPPQAMYQPTIVPGQPMRPIQQPFNIIQQYPAGMPPNTHSSPNSSNSQRPASSSSMQGSRHSPIQNRPSMSPTQGNPDVGPLAGFPPTQPTGAVPSTPFGARMQNDLSSGSPYPVGPPPNQSPSVSFSSATTPQQNNSFSHTPTSNRYSPGMPMSGRSPTKNSPPRPPSFNELGNAATVLPPVQRLQPSPKLMGRSSPDAPIPPPVKHMTPEQDDRRRREEQLAAQQIVHQQQAQQHPHALPQTIPPLTSAQPQQQHGLPQNIPPLTSTQPQQQQ